MTVKIVMCRKFVAASSCPWNISSRIVRIERSDVSLKSPTNMLPIGGMTMRNACGKTTIRITCTRDIPERERCLGLPAIDGLDPRAVDLGEIGGVRGAHADDASCPGIELDAGKGEDVVEIEELKQHGRAAQHLDVDRRWHAQQRVMRHPRQRNREGRDQGDAHDDEGRRAPSREDRPAAPASSPESRPSQTS